MAEGVKSEYDKIKATDIFEYYTLFDLWREKVNKQREYYEQKNRNHGK